MSDHPTIARYSDEPWTILRLAGEFDLPWSGTLRDGCAEAIHSGTSLPRVILDLTEVTFMDSTALGIIAGLHKTVTHHEGCLALAGAQGSVRHVLRMTQLDELIDSYPTLEDALRLARSP